MKILAIPGSGRAASTNTAMLRTIASIFAGEYDIEVFNGIAGLPVFSPDLEEERLPDKVHRFVALMQASDVLIVSSPEYVRAIPGGLKNAIDWLVSRSEIIGKYIAILHASDRGDDMLVQLRLVLSTVSDRFSDQAFLRINLLSLSPEEVNARIALPENIQNVRDFLSGITREHQAALGSSIA